MSHIKIVLSFVFLFSLSLANLNAQPSLADEIAGTYTGKLGKNGDQINDYQLTISKVSDTSVAIAPVSGDASTIFEATLSETFLGSIRTISFATDADLMLQNATLVPSSGRFAYAIVKIDAGGRKIEVFNGNKD